MTIRLLLSFSLVMIWAGEPGIPPASLSAPVRLTAMEANEIMEAPQVRTPAGQTGNPQRKDRLRSRSNIRLRRGHGSPRTTWVRTYWREGTLTATGVGVIYGFRMAPANDGGLFLLGHTSAQIPASYDSCILKVDPAGSIEWQRVFRQGTGEGYTQFLHSISPTSDGGCVAGGICASGVVAIKFEATGDVAWRRTFGREGTREEFADLQQTNDGGYLLLASSGLMDTTGIANERDVLLIKLDPLGDPVWQKTYGGPFDEGAKGFVQLADGGFAVCGYASSQPDGSGKSLLLLRLTTSGDIVWQTVYQGWDAPVFSFEPTLDGGMIVAGLAYESDSELSWDAWAMKLTAGGAVEWKKTYHGNYGDSFISIIATLDGGYLAAGDTGYFSSQGRRALLVKLSSNGDFEWQKAYGGEDVLGGYSSGRSAVPAPDRALYLGGTTSFGGMGGVRFLLVKASAEGLVERLPGFVADAGLEVQDSSVEALPATLIPQEVPILSSITELTPLEVAVHGGLLFSPPINIAARTSSSRSLALIDRTNVLSWEPNPANDDLEIDKYRIYSVGPIPSDSWIISEGSERLDEVEGDVYRYFHYHVKAGGPYIYLIWGVGADGGEGLATRLCQPGANRRP